MSNNPPATPWLDALTTAVGPVIWGSTYIVTTELLPPDRPLTAALLRTLPAGLLLVWWWCRWPAWGDWTGWGRLWVLAALNIGVFQALLFIAAYRLPGGVAAVVGAIGPLVVMALGWALDHRRPPALALGAGAVGVLGMAALLLSPGARWDGVGVAAALVGTLCMATGTFWSRRWRFDLPVLAFTGWQLLAGGLMLAPVAWVVDPPLPALTPTHVVGYLYLSLVGALLSYAVWFRGVERLPSVAVSSLLLLSPVTAVVLGWAVLGQAMRGLSLLGMLAVLGSIVAVQWAMSRPQAPVGS